MDPLPYSHLKKGTLLIATPDIESGVFFRCVILLCEHNATGSFGLVINKILDVDLPDEIISETEAQNPNIQIRQGGPVQTNQMMLLHTSPEIPHQTLEICDGVFLGGDIQFLQHSLHEVRGPKVNLCFGYAGWGAGQLEREFLDGQWYLAEADQQAIFEIEPKKLWRHLLREMGGKFAALSMIPEDLTLN